MPPIVTIQNKKSKTLTTGQVSGILRVSPRTLRSYVSMFRANFSPSVAQRSRGRRWEQRDLEMAAGIRSLFHERAGESHIRELLASGWRLENEGAWSRELIARLISKILDAYEDLKASTREVITLKRILEEHKRDNQAFQSLWIRQGDLEHEWMVHQKADGLRTVIKKAVKKKWRGEPPELYPPADK